MTSGFVASPHECPVPASDTTDMVDGGPFYPALSISEFKDSGRLSNVASDVRARDALRAGLLTVRVELRAWAAAKIAAGYPTLDAVEADELDFESVLLILFRRAVHSFAAAELVETHNDISATKDGKDRIEEQVLTADEHRRNGTHAIRDILGVSRTTVELI